MGGGGKDVFHKGDVVALRAKHRGVLPHAHRLQKFFKIVKLRVPRRCRYAAKCLEPKWATIQPSGRRGELVQGAAKLAVCLSWLDAKFCLSSDEAAAEDTPPPEGFEPDLTAHRVAVAPPHAGGVCNKDVFYASVPDP